MAPAHITDLGTRRREQERIGTTLAHGRVADVMSTTFVRVPVWFTIAQATQVAALKGVSHLLVEEHGRVSGSVGVSALLQAPGQDSVGRWTSRSQSSLAPDLALQEAERRLRAEGVTCLPVVAGGLLVGTVSLQEVGGDVAHAA